MSESWYVEADTNLQPTEASVKWKVVNTVGLLDVPNPDSTKRSRRYVRLDQLGQRLAEGYGANGAGSGWQWVNTMPANHTLLGRSATQVCVVWRVLAGQTQTYRTHTPDRHRELCTHTVLLPELAYIQVWPLQQLNRPPTSTGVVIAATGPIWDLNSQVIPWPWGNVYTTGHVCWGTMLCTTTLATFHKIAGLFFEGTFNTDLFRGTPQQKAHLSNNPPPNDEPYALVVPKIMSHQDTLQYFVTTIAQGH